MLPSSNAQTEPGSLGINAIHPILHGIYAFSTFFAAIAACPAVPAEGKILIGVSCLIFRAIDQLVVFIELTKYNFIAIYRELGDAEKVLAICVSRYYALKSLNWFYKFLKKYWTNIGQKTAYPDYKISQNKDSHQTLCHQHSTHQCTATY